MKSNSSNNELKNITKESITTALFILMQQKPYHEISITDICKRAGVSRNAFYRNYSVKDEILRLYLFEITDEWRKRLRQNASITYYSLFLYLFRHLEQNKSLAQLLLKSGLDYLMIDVFFKSFRDLAEDKSGKPMYYLAFLSGAVYTVFVHWIANDQSAKPEQIAEIICRFAHLPPNEVIQLPEMSSIHHLMYELDFSYRKD